MSATVKGLAAWFQERFPALNFITAFIMYGMVASVARHLAGVTDLSWGVKDLVGAFSLCLYFLILRVNDEHKDFEADLINFPKRVLQSGRIKLHHLKVVSVLSLLFQVMTALWMDQGLGLVTVALGANLLLASLMYKEFFVKSWLQKHMMVYGLLHLLAAPSTAFWIVTMSAPELLHGAGEMGLWLLIGLPFFAGMVFELVRKSFGAEEERETLESYSRVFGSRKISVIIGFFMIGTLMIQLFLMEFINADLSFKYSWIPWAGFILGLLGLGIYSSRPVHKCRKLNEATTGVFILSNYILLMVMSFAA